MQYYIIEHPRRGCFREIDYGLGGSPPRPHFSLMGDRADEDVSRFFTIEAASRMLQKFPSHLQHECYVLCSPEGDKAEWQRVEVIA